MVSLMSFAPQKGHLGNQEPQVVASKGLKKLGQGMTAKLEMSDNKFRVRIFHQPRIFKATFLRDSALPNLHGHVRALNKEQYHLKIPYHHGY